MSTFACKIAFIVLIATTLVFLNGCENEKSGSLYDAGASSRPQPTISTITPTGFAYAGMDTIVIAGTNFSPTLTENSVYFNVTAAALLSSTSTQIRLAAPLVTSDGIAVRIAVFGSELFSNSFQYNLKPAVVGFGSMPSFELASVTTTDAAGNLLVSYTSTGAEAGVLKFTPAGVRSIYAPPTAGVAVWSCIRMGPSNTIYAARNVRAIYAYPPGGGASASLWVALPSGTTVADLDFDASKNIWAVGNNSNIYQIQPNKTITPFPFVGNVHHVRVYGGYLYFAARTDAGEQIWRAQITSTSMGTPEVYFGFANAYPNKLTTSITFSSDGVLYIGTDDPGRIVVVQQNKAYGAPYRAYNALITPSCNNFSWGNGETLYAVGGNNALLSVMVRGKQSAPYYGTN